MRDDDITNEDFSNLEKQLKQKEKEFEEFLRKIKSGEVEIDEEKWGKLKKEIGYKGFFEED